MASALASGGGSAQAVLSGRPQFAAKVATSAWASGGESAHATDAGVVVSASDSAMASVIEPRQYGDFRSLSARPIWHAHLGGSVCWTIEPVEVKLNVLADAGTAVVLSASVTAMATAMMRIPMAR